MDYIYFTMLCITLVLLCITLVMLPDCITLILFCNMSYGAAVGASTANSNLIEFKNNFYIFTPVLNKSYVYC